MAERLGAGAAAPGGGGSLVASRHRKLKPGPGRPPGEVAADQRARLRQAMVELVNERGYEQVRVRELAGRAQVSQATLYRHYTSKDECFLDAYEQIVNGAARATLAAQRRATDWRERLRLGVSAFVGECGRAPRAAHFAVVDCFSAWPHSMERMLRTGGLFEALVADGVAKAPDGGVRLPPPLARAIVAGIAAVVRERLLTGRERELADLGEELAAWADSLLSEAPGNLGRLREPQAMAPPAANDFCPAPLDDRSLLLSATVRLATEDGFDQLTVPRIRAAAGLSRRSFDAHFEDVTDCFLAAVEQHSDYAIAHAARAGAASRDWPRAICRAVAAFCDLAASDERLVKMLFVEVFASGPAGLRCRARLMAELAGKLRASAPAAQRPSMVAAEASLGAIWALVYTQIAAGRAARMAEISGTLAFIALAPAIGPEAAVEAIEAPRRPSRSVRTGINVRSQV